MHNTKSKKGRVILSLLLTIVMVFSVITIGATTTTAETSTGIGLSAHCLKAYNEGWAYVWGGMSPGAVDCSGMIQLYNGVGGVRTDMVSSSPEWGYVSNGIPRIHGLGLHKPGHVGVYVGSDLAIDARGTNWGVCFNSVDAVNWVEWFKVYGVSYPTQGWVRFNGNSFYYENGQYIVNTSRTLDGVSYYFDSTGASDKQPPESSYKVTDYSGKGSGSSSSGSGSSGSYLKIGSQGSKVEDVQKKLKKLGYFDDDVTGYYGTYTAACVKEFQADANIEVDGVVGPEFLSVINGDNPPRKNTSNNETNNNNSADEPADNTYEEENNDVAEEPTEEVTEPTEAPTQAPTEEPTEAPTEAPTEEATEAPTATEKPTEAPTEAPTSDGTLRYGDSGEEITKLQNRLAELGYYTADVTSVFDDNTLDALHSYFSASELMQNNEITKEQLAVLYSASAVMSPSTYVVSVENQSSDEVKAIQEDLVTLGYLDKASGTYDADTESAVKVAQSNFDMKVTGTADEEFVDALELETARQNSQTVENATVKNVAENNNALAPLNTDGVKSVTNGTAKENSLVLAWVAAAMIILALTATIVYVKHRKSRKSYRK